MAKLLGLIRLDIGLRLLELSLKELEVLNGKLWLFAMIAGLLVLPGCDNDPLQKVFVKGVVTFDGGPCPGTGRVTFSPVEIPEGLPNRPAIGGFKTDGAYEAMSFRPGDGVVPGKYLVSVACFDPAKLGPEPGDAQFRKASYVSEEFEPIELVVEAGSGVINFDIDVIKRKH